MNTIIISNGVVKMKALGRRSRRYARTAKVYSKFKVRHEIWEAQDRVCEERSEFENAVQQFKHPKKHPCLKKLRKVEGVAI